MTEIERLQAALDITVTMVEQLTRAVHHLNESHNVLGQRLGVDVSAVHKTVDEITSELLGKEQSQRVAHYLSLARDAGASGYAEEQQELEPGDFDRTGGCC